MQKPVIKTVAGRVRWVGTFPCASGEKAIKLVVLPDPGQPKAFADRVEVLVFNRDVKEFLMDGELQPDGTWRWLGGHAKAGDHIVAKGSWQREEKTKGRKKYINRKIVLERRSDLTWQKVATLGDGPYASADPTEAEDSPI